MKLLIAALAALAITAASLAPAEAAPAAQACQATAFRQVDMTGTFLSGVSQMRVEIYPCGGSYVQWDNAYGTHYATYYSDTRLAGGGVAAGLIPNGLMGLDGATRIGFKPAEPGWIQVITVDAYGNVLGVYRLRKMSSAT